LRLAPAELDARAQARLASFGPHFEEEEPLVGWGGSGTVFFSGCNLSCVFCQNASISQGRAGVETGRGRLAQVFLDLTRGGRHNLNLVTPNHQAAAIVAALAQAAENGFDLPVV
jgi:putative pyruvate formate lyase activating enzyme